VRESNTCVSSCAFDDGSAGVQETELLGILDDEERSAVLDGTTGVLEFSFAEDVAAGFFGEFLEADQRGFSNCCGESV
jgi:hypothetical protein